MQLEKNGDLNCSKITSKFVTKACTHNLKIQEQILISSGKKQINKESQTNLLEAKKEALDTIPNQTSLKTPRLSVAIKENLVR